MVARRGCIDEIPEGVVVEQIGPFIFVAGHVHHVTAAEHQGRIPRNLFHHLDQRQRHGIFTVLEVGEGHEVPAAFLPGGPEGADIRLRGARHNLETVCGIGFQSAEGRVADVAFLRAEGGSGRRVLDACAAPALAHRPGLPGLCKLRIRCERVQDVAVAAAAMVIHRDGRGRILADRRDDVVNIAVGLGVGCGCSQQRQRNEGSEEGTFHDYGEGVQSSTRKSPLATRRRAVR